MEITKQKDKLKLTWKTKVQTLKFIKNDKEYYSYNTSFPIDLRNYIVNGMGQFDKIDFYVHKGNIVVSSSGVATAEDVLATAKIVEGEKNQLVYTLPKKVLKSIRPYTDSIILYSLEYVEEVEDYLIFVKVE